jgi:hypothetical protein
MLLHCAYFRGCHLKVRDFVNNFEAFWADLFRSFFSALSRRATVWFSLLKLLSLTNYESNYTVTSYSIESFRAFFLLHLKENEDIVSYLDFT